MSPTTQLRKRPNISRDEVLADWTGRAEIDEPLELAFTASRQWLVNSGLFGLIRGEIGRARCQETVISGTAGCRRQIKRPESFLNNVILTSPPARAWLAAQLSISRHMYYLNRATSAANKLPRIWLVTGIQYIANAEVAVTRAQSKKLSASANVPIPEPIAAAAVVLGGQAGIAAGIERSDMDRSTTSYHHKDERVWAAQFTQLSVQFSTKPVSVGDLPTRLRLHDLVDLKSGGTRSREGSDIPSLDEEIADISTLDEDETLQPHGESLIHMMQDVDWLSMDRLLMSASLQDYKKKREV